MDGWTFKGMMWCCSDTLCVKRNIIVDAGSDGAEKEIVQINKNNISCYNLLVYNSHFQNQF